MKARVLPFHCNACGDKKEFPDDDCVIDVVVTDLAGVESTVSFRVCQKCFARAGMAAASAPDPDDPPSFPFN